MQATSRLPWPLSDVTLFGGSERSEEGHSRSEIVVVGLGMLMLVETREEMEPGVDIVCLELKMGRIRCDS